jgi:NAD(P)H-hydrate repair Nnr-like enzyme with NAD(P)H-hydrate epimerase domain
MLVVTASQMQEIDKKAIEGFSIPGLILMENAGRGIFELICRHFAARLHQGVTILVTWAVFYGTSYIPSVKLKKLLF